MAAVLEEGDRRAADVRNAQDSTHPEVWISENVEQLVRVPDADMVAASLASSAEQLLGRGYPAGSLVWDGYLFHVKHRVSPPGAFTVSDH